MYKLYFLQYINTQYISMRYMCHSVDKPYHGITVDSLNIAIDPANFTHGAQPWHEWVKSFTVSHTIIFDSIEQLKLDYPELLI